MKLNASFFIYPCDLSFILYGHNDRRFTQFYLQALLGLI